MEDPKFAAISNRETKERVEVELHELSEGTHIESKYMGTNADRHDMNVLGRKQVLRVCQRSYVLAAFNASLKIMYLTTNKTISSETSTFFPWWALLPF